VAGGAAALHAPLFAMHGVLVADNGAGKGGAVHVATDFAPAAAACAASAAQGLDCTAPLQDLNFTGCAFVFCVFAMCLLAVCADAAATAVLQQHGACGRLRFLEPRRQPVRGAGLPRLRHRCDAPALSHLACCC
jgi:hypothetical protein